MKTRTNRQRQIDAALREAGHTNLDEFHRHYRDNGWSAQDIAGLIYASTRERVSASTLLRWYPMETTA